MYKLYSSLHFTLLSIQLGECDSPIQFSHHSVDIVVGQMRFAHTIFASSVGANRIRPRLHSPPFIFTPVYIRPRLYSPPFAFAHVYIHPIIIRLYHYFIEQMPIGRMRFAPTETRYVIAITSRINLKTPLHRPQNTRVFHLQRPGLLGINTLSFTPADPGISYTPRPTFHLFH